MMTAFYLCNRCEFPEYGRSHESYDDCFAAGMESINKTSSCLEDSFKQLKRDQERLINLWHKKRAGKNK